MAMMGTASASGPDRARIAAQQAIACPLLEGVDLTNAKGILLLITASEATLKLSESRNAMNTVRQFAAEDAHVIYGTTYDDSLGEEIRITVMATGLGKSQTRSNSQAINVSNVTTPPVISHTNGLMTGTDNANVSYRPSPFSNNVNSNTSTINNSISGSMSTYQQPPPSTRGAAGSLMTKHPDRTHAVAQVNAMTTKGIDEMDIPAYLRKQAD
jgi:cell division protein FtsZ